MKFFNELPSKTIAAFIRFPLTIVWTLFGSFYVIFLIETNTFDFENSYAELLTLVLGVSWLIGVQFFAESLYNKKVGWFIKILVLGLLVAYYFSLPDKSNTSNPVIYIRWFLLVLTGHIFVFFAPFIKQWDKIDYWNYLQNIITAIARSALFSIVIYAGVALAILAIDNLFAVRIDGDIYAQLYVFCLGIVNTFIYLSDFPKKIHETRELHYSKALDVFLKYILIPILALYLIIVYAYAIKIVLAWKLPQGWVSYLISILAIIGFIIQIIIEPIRKTHSSLLIKKFYPLFYLLLLPLLVLLSVAIYTRISDYNFTENRYFLVLLAGWILGMSIYMLFSKKKRLVIFPISLFILCFLSSYGPWSAFNVAIQAQASEFKQLISKIKTQNDELISNEEATQFKSIARYLKERNKLYLVDESLGFKTNYVTNHYNAGKFLLDSLYGRETTPLFTSSNSYQNNHFYYNQYNYNTPLQLDITDYEKLLELNLGANTSSNYTLTHTTNRLLLKKNERLLFEFDLDKELLSTLSTYQDFSNAPKEAFTYTFSNDVGNYKLILKNFNFEKIEKTSINLNHLNAIILIQFKKL